MGLFYFFTTQVVFCHVHTRRNLWEMLLLDYFMVYMILFDRKTHNYYTGPPWIRVVPPVVAISGEFFMLNCPISGWPISFGGIQWEKGKREFV